MEEKKTAKISLSLFLLIIAIIVIAVMGYFIYKLNNDKTAEIQKLTVLQEQVNSLTETVSALQEKISNTSNAEKNNNYTEKVTENNNNTNSTSFTYNQVQIALSNYLDLHGHAGCSSLIETLTEKGKLNYDYTKDTIQSDYSILTNVKFSEYKKAMLNYVSEAEFERNWHLTLNLKEGKNGYLTRLEGGGGLRVYTIKSIEKTNNLTYTAKVTSVVDDNEYFEEKNITFNISSYNGICVIDFIQ